MQRTSHTFERLLSVSGTFGAAYGTGDSALLNRVTDRICAELEITNDIVLRERVANIVLLASQVNEGEAELFILASKALKRGLGYSR